MYICTINPYWEIENKICKSVYICMKIDTEWLRTICRAKTPDCCSVVLLPMAPIPTYRLQSPAIIGFPTYAATIGFHFINFSFSHMYFGCSQAHVCKKLFRCFPLPSLHHSSRMKMPLEALQPPSNFTKTHFAFPFYHLYTSPSDPSHNRQLFNHHPLDQTLLLCSPSSLEQKSCKINHFVLFLY